jgi:hypothetical protein
MTDRPDGELPMWKFLSYCAVVIVAGPIAILLWSACLNAGEAFATKATTADGWIQAIASVAGSIVAVVGTYAVARWQILSPEKKRQNEDRAACRVFLTEYLKLALLDVQILEEVAAKLPDKTSTRILNRDLARLNVSTMAASAMDETLVRTSPLLFAQFNYLRVFREHAIKSGRGKPDENSENYNAADFVYVLAEAWILFLEIVEIDLQNAWPGLNPRDRLNRIKQMAKPHRSALAIQEQMLQASLNGDR